MNKTQLIYKISGWASITLGTFYSIFIIIYLFIFISDPDVIGKIWRQTEPFGQRILPVILIISLMIMGFIPSVCYYVGGIRLLKYKTSGKTFTIVASSLVLFVLVIGFFHGFMKTHINATDIVIPSVIALPQIILIVLSLHCTSNAHLNNGKISKNDSNRK